MKWIKASERKPEDDKPYIIKLYDSVYWAEYRNNIWFAPGTNYTLTNDLGNNIEWLDESPSHEKVTNPEHSSLCEKDANQNSSVGEVKSPEELWDLYSRAIPEDTYGGAEEIADMVAGKSIMYEKDFKEAMKIAARQFTQKETNT